MPQLWNLAGRGEALEFKIVTGRDGVMLAPVYGLSANRNRGKCASSGCVAIAAVPIPPLRRELSRPHEHRLRGARHERGSRPDRFSVRHCERDFFYWLLRAANSGGIVGRTLERAAIAHVNSDNLGRAYHSDWVRSNRSSTLRRAVSARRGGGGIFSWCNRLPLSLVHLSRPGQSPFALYVRDSNRVYHRRTDCSKDPGCSMAWNRGMAVAFFVRRNPGGSNWNRDVLRVAGSASRGSMAARR